MTDQKGLVSPPPDLQSSASTIQPLHQPLQPPHSHHPKLLVSIKSSISSQQGGGAAQDKLFSEHIMPIPCTKWRNYCNPSSADNSTREGNMDACMYERGNWLEEDKIFPFKKRRVLLILDNAPGTTATLQGEVLKNAGNARASRKCTMKIRADHVLSKDDDIMGPPEMINGTLAAGDKIKREKMINNSTSTRCTRTNGKGWRCSQPSFAGHTMCYNHWTSTKNSRRKQRGKKNSNPRKLAVSKVNVTPTSSDTTLMRRKQINADNARKSKKRTKNIRTDQRDGDFEGFLDVMNGIAAAKNTIMEEENMDNCTNTRCVRTNGKRWRCSRPRFASSPSGEHHWTTWKKEIKKKNNDGSVPRQVALSNVKITPSSPTTFLQRENRTIGNARKSKKCTNKKRGDHELNKDDDFKAVADVINSSSAAKKIKMKEKTWDNCTTTRCARTNGKGWRCSQSTFAGSSLCEYHWTARRNERKSKSPTTLLQRKTMKVGNARRNRKCANKILGDHVRNKDDDDFEGVADVMINSIPAAKEIKMEEKTMDNITNYPRCTRASGNGWRCSQPSFAGYSMCEYHCSAKKKKNSVPHKAAESQVKPTSTTQFIALDTGSNLSDIGDSYDLGEVLPQRRLAAVKARSISSLLH